MPTILKYVLLVILGAVVIFICSLLQHVPAPAAGEYHISDFLRNNYTLLTIIVFIITGMILGYYLQLNPWGAGICMILVFPLVTFYEATVYRGSHNLLPFELIMHFLMALPAIAGIYLGKLLNKKLSKKLV